MGFARVNRFDFPGLNDRGGERLRQSSYQFFAEVVFLHQYTKKGDLD